MVKSERAHDRISAGFSQLLQFPYILLLGNLLCQKSVLQLLCLDYMSVPLIRGNPAPPLTGLQPVVDPAILPSSGFGLLLFLLPLMSSYLPTSLAAGSRYHPVTVTGIVSISPPSLETALSVLIWLILILLGTMVGMVVLQTIWSGLAALWKAVQMLFL